MAQILIRNLDEGVVERLKERAKKQGRSLQSEVRMILEREGGPPELSRAEGIAAIMRIRKQLAGRKFPDTVALIREGRD